MLELVQLSRVGGEGVKNARFALLAAFVCRAASDVRLRIADIILREKELDVAPLPLSRLTATKNNVKDFKDPT